MPNSIEIAKSIKQKKIRADCVGPALKPVWGGFVGLVSKCLFKHIWGGLL